MAFHTIFLSEQLAGRPSQFIGSAALHNSNSFVTIMQMEKIKVVEYLQDGVSIFEKWFSGLDAQAAAKIATALYRLEQGNLSNVKSVGQGVSEYKKEKVRRYHAHYERISQNNFEACRK
jgi:putative addiction module killer protein